MARRLACLALALLAAPGARGLVVEVPCCSAYTHMPAAFGPRLSGADGVRGALADTRDVSSNDMFLCLGPLAQTDSLAGKIAFVPRGHCNFFTKIVNAQMSGATGVVVYNPEPPLDGNTLVRMSVDNEQMADSITIPAVFVSMETAMSISFTLNSDGPGSVTVHINGTQEYDTDMLDPMPMIMQSIWFMLQMVLSIWAIVGVFYLFNWCKARMAKKRRLGMVRKLPTRQFRAAVPAAAQVDAATVELTISDAAPRHPLRPEHHRVPSSDDLEAIELAPLPSMAPPAAAAAAPSGAITDYFAGESCVVCICDFEDGEWLTLLPCGHGFHQSCIEPWLVHKSALCPICKQSILPSGDARSLDEIAAADDSDTRPGAQGVDSIARAASIMLAGVLIVAGFSSIVYMMQSDL